MKGAAGGQARTKETRLRFLVEARKTGAWHNVQSLTPVAVGRRRDERERDNGLSRHRRHGRFGNFKRQRRRRTRQQRKEIMESQLDVYALQFLESVDHVVRTLYGVGESA